MTDTQSDSRPLCTREFVPAIADAVEAVNDSNSEHVHGVRYNASDGYYPDETEHLVDLSGVEPKYRSAASIQVQTELNRRGLLANSVRIDPPALHVVSIDWLTEIHADGERNRSTEEGSATAEHRSDGGYRCLACGNGSFKISMEGYRVAVAECTDCGMLTHFHDPDSNPLPEFDAEKVRKNRDVEPGTEQPKGADRDV